MTSPLSIVICLAFMVYLAYSPDFAQAYDGDFDDKPWVEQQAQLPPFPKAENLLKIPMNTMSAFEVWIDSASIDIGRDGVVRYTFVARSARGGENVSFEGMRCETRERKLYAVGRSDKTWGQVRNATWAGYGSNPRSHHYELATEYFCPDYKNVMSLKDALRNLKEGGVRTARSKAERAE